MTRREAFAVAFDHAPPSDIAGQIGGCDTIEPCQPSFEPARVGVNVLDMEALIAVFAAAGDDRYMQDRVGMGKGTVGVAAVGDEHGILGNDRRQMSGEGRCGQVGKDRVGCCAMAVADNENTVVLVGGQARFFGLATALSGASPDKSL